MRKMYIPCQTNNKRRTTGNERIFKNEKISSTNKKEDRMKTVTLSTGFEAAIYAKYPDLLHITSTDESIGSSFTLYFPIDSESPKKLSADLHFLFGPINSDPIEREDLSIIQVTTGRYKDLSKLWKGQRIEKKALKEAKEK